jgi:hypothetical protein
MRRSAELARLRGLQYLASLLLEAADLLLPVARTLWRRAAALLSWLLTAVVGRAAGLVFRGVRSAAQPGGGGVGARQHGAVPA